MLRNQEQIRLSVGTLRLLSNQKDYEDKTVCQSAFTNVRIPIEYAEKSRTDTPVCGNASFTKQ
jgi:hypothetical protein